MAKPTATRPLAIRSYGQLTESQKFTICNLLMRGEILPDIHDIMIREVYLSIPLNILRKVQNFNAVRIQRMVEYERQRLEVNGDAMAFRADNLLRKMMNRSIHDFDKRTTADAEYSDGAINDEEYSRIITSLYILPVNDLQRISNHFANSRATKAHMANAVARRKAEPVKITDEAVKNEPSKPLSLEQLQEIQDAVKSGRAVDVNRAIKPSLPPEFRYGDKVPSVNGDGEQPPQ